MLHGQHLAWGTIANHIISHFSQQTPRKALVLSFHGETGTGKNYASEIIIKNVFRYGIKSDFVHVYHAAVHFPHESMSHIYIEKLKHEIKNAVYLCPRAVFIFDEFHLMPPKVIDILQVYLDFHAEVDGIDFRKAVFIFISNLASENIRNFTISQYKKGIDRHDIKLRDLEFSIAHASLTQKGGFYGSDLIKSHLVTAYIPFLPLQRTHVKQCINDEMKRRNPHKIYNEEFINKVLIELHFVNSFSETGCKRVFEKVAFALINDDL
ncbi:torsin-1A-like [Octopus sinensis]|uniref:Torsin-1A-like n=1 Tax=Octopus sinensis TaxID=2607531 RepID=A0A7E6EZU2_9MOLL|nr:torsin-1A-like [Octopus sinensis]